MPGVYCFVTQSFLDYFGARARRRTIAVAVLGIICIVQAAARGSEVHEKDLAAFFQEVDATYPFFDLKGIRDEWAACKQRLGTNVKSCASDTEFLGIVAEAIRCLRDAHMGLSKVKAQMPQLPRKCYPGLSFMPATQGRVVVMWAADAHAAKLKPGMVVTRIDGQPARAFLDARAKAAWEGESLYSVGSPQRARLFTYRIGLAGQRGEEHILHYLAQGKEQELQVACDQEVGGWPHTYNLPGNLKRPSRSVAYGKLPSGAGYMHLRYVRTETEPGMRQAVSAHPDAKGWIIDLRGNGGGGYDNSLLELLKTLPRPVAVLIDAGCISAGETLARDLAKTAEARLFGAHTAGSSSSKRQWTFPSGIASVTFSTRSRWRNDGQPVEFNGVAPDVELEAVPEEVAQGLNSEIRRAEEYLADVLSKHPELVRQNQEAAAQRKASRPVIAGRVSDSDGKPIAGAKLSAVPWSDSSDRRNLQTVSGETGEFRLEDLGPNVEYRVFVQAKDRIAAFAQTTTGASGTNECNFLLAEGIPLFGRVADTNNQPVPGVTLELVPITWSGDGSQGLLPLGLGELLTDSEGRFNVPAAAPGRYWLKVYQPSPTGGDRCWQQMALNQKLALTTGTSARNLDVRILPPNAHFISGVVQDGQGKPLSGIPVGTYIPHDRSWWTRTDAQGRFMLRSLNGIGRDLLDVNVDCPGQQVVFRRVPIGMKDLKFVRHAPGHVSGLLLNEEGTAPVTQYELKVARVHLLDCNGIVREPGVRITRTGPPGAFQVAQVPPGRVILEFKVSERRQWSEVQVAAGQEVRDQRIRLQPPCVFEGTALFTSASGEKQNVGLEVFHLETGQGLPGIESLASGAFRCDTLPAGRYAIRGLHGSEVYQTKEVRLEHGKTTRETFTLGGTATIKGAIRLPVEDCGSAYIYLREPKVDGAPNVWLGRPETTAHVLSWNMVRKPSDTYEIRHVPAGTWEVVAFAPASERCIPFDRLPHAAHTVTVTDGETERLDLDLTVGW